MPSQNPPPPHQPTPFIHLYTLNALLERRGVKSRKIASRLPSLPLTSSSLSHMLSLFFCCFTFNFHHPSPVPATPPPPSSSSSFHPKPPPLFKVPCIRSHQRQKTGVILGIHVSSFTFVNIISSSGVSLIPFSVCVCEHLLFFSPFCSR